MRVVTKPKPEVELRRCCRILEQRYDVISQSPIFHFEQNVYTDAESHGSKIQGHCQNRKWNSKMVAVCFLKPQVVISQPWI